MSDIKKFIKENSVDEGFLQDWYQNSVVDTDEPVWTDEHIAEVYGDFYLIPKETVEKLKVIDNTKIKFCDIKEKEIAIHFTTQAQLEKLVDYLKAYGYDYGTGGSNIETITELGIHYFSGTHNQYLTLDRKRSYHPRNYVSCGLGHNATKYNFKDIDWKVSKS